MTDKEIQQIKIWLREISREAEYTASNVFTSDKVTETKETLKLVVDKLERLVKAIRKKI